MQLSVIRENPRLMGDRGRVHGHHQGPRRSWGGVTAMESWTALVPGAQITGYVEIYSLHVAFLTPHHSSEQQQHGRRVYMFGAW